MLNCFYLMAGIFQHLQLFFANKVLYMQVLKITIFYRKIVPMNGVLTVFSLKPGACIEAPRYRPSIE